MTSARTIAATAASLLIACGGGNDARVGIDLTPLWDQAGVSAQIDVIHVRVYDDQGLLEVESELTSTGAVVDLVVSAGVSRRFEVEAVFDDGGVATPTYWGEHITDLQGDADVNLVVPIFPAGQLRGTVTVIDGTDVPPGAKIIAAARAPRLDAPAAPAVLIDAGKFAITLPTGTYDLTVGDPVSGAPYVRTDGAPAVVVGQGEILAGIGITIVPP